MYNNPINFGPGPSHPVTDFKQALTLQIPKRGYINIHVEFNAAWVHYVYVYDTGSNRVIAELSNESGGSKDWDSASNPDFAGIFVGILDYHKNVSPGHESPDDIFIQGTIARHTTQKNPNNVAITLGFNDGGGSSDDNALVAINLVEGS